MLQASFYIPLICIDKAGGIGDRPAIFMVVQDRYLCICFCAANGIQLFQADAHLLHILKHPTGGFPIVVDHRTVELFRTATTLPPLEILYAVAAVGHCLQRSQPMHTGPLQLADCLPIRIAGRAFHQQERLVL